ncbi:DNA cytosine methyltransferase [Streptomyces sp. T12]|uniref:DNA cytosine methyltransferase n=1 Tax=Streptomyces sp. T12 TaxID=477697 RepID=UPI0035A3C153
MFAGPGGWSHALTVLGARDVGLEWDEWACKTRARAGQLTIRTDVAVYPAWIFSGRILGLIASPPCQAWSMAGKRLGLVDQPLVHQAVADLAAGRDTREQLLGACADPRSLLAAEPMRYLHALNTVGEPEWVLMEEVPDVLPLWRQYAAILRAWGFSAWTGILNAADYGVPQTRKRTASKEEDLAEERLLLATATAYPAEVRQMRWLTEADFLLSLHAALWQSITTLVHRGDMVDPITVLGEAQPRGLLTGTLTPKALMDLVSTPAGSPEYWGEKILGRALLARAQTVAARITAYTDDLANTPHQLVTGSRRALADLNSLRTRWMRATAPRPRPRPPKASRYAAGNRPARPARHPSPHYSARAPTDDPTIGPGHLPAGPGPKRARLPCPAFLPTPSSASTPRSSSTSIPPTPPQSSHA